MNGPIRPLLLWLYRLVLRSGAALRPFWLSAYEVAIRAYGAYLTRGVSGAAVYVRGSWGAGDAVPALSDVDLAVVVPPGGRARVRRRWLRARRRIGDRLFDWPLVLGGRPE